VLCRKTLSFRELAALQVKKERHLVDLPINIPLVEMEFQVSVPAALIVLNCDCAMANSDDWDAPCRASFDSAYASTQPADRLRLTLHGP
jgi:hypothetical protein